MRLHWTVWAVTAVALLGIVGCAAGSGDTSVGTAEPETGVGLVGQKEPPSLTYTEWRLPDNAMLQDHGDRFAVLLDNNFDDVGGVRIRLLDMETGVHRVVVPDTLGRAESYLTLGLHCSDRWVVWEEIRGDEVADPLDVEWRLWAAPIDPVGTTVGPPALLRESVVSVRSRPLFDVVGDTLYVMSNTFPNPKQEGATYRSSIVSLGLGVGTEREIYTSDRMLHVFAVQDDELIVTEYVDHDSKDCRIRVLGLDDGAERFAYEPGSRGISHWPAYSDGTLLWAADAGPAAPWPTLWCRRHDGTVLKVAEQGLDTAIVGPYVFYREYVTDRPTSGRGRESATIHGLELATLRSFELVRTAPAGEGYWQPMIDSHREEHTYVIWNQLFTADVGADRGGTYVRRYHVP